MNWFGRFDFFITITLTTLLSMLSLVHFVSYEVVTKISLPHVVHTIFMVADVLLLLYFLSQGILRKHKLVSLFALVQIALYSVVLFSSPTLTSSDILIDEVSSLMYLVINIVGGLIIIYALEYIKSEEFSRFKKSAFIFTLFLFLAVMNLIVSVNNVEMFFTLFELTTLFSYLLIGYRKNEVSTKNALRALWMNQIGGVAILIALIASINHYDTIYFDELIKNANSLYLLPIVFLAIGAFVKGASVPFDRWLLGAMVAPTPVSAMLHSATMVKIAPYLMLKLAPAMSEFVSIGVTLFGTFVFFSASLMALGKDYFKEILGLSTIALLALMMALASIGTPEAITACLTLIVFHAISKALLFLQAGILEKSFHLKYVNEIDGLINHSPLVVMFILFGFASLTLPPFGAFIAKFMAIESISSEISKNPLYVLALVFILLGSVSLTLLYFKVVTKLFARDENANKAQATKIPLLFSLPSWILVFLLFVGMYVSYDLEFLSAYEIVVPALLILTLPLFFAKVLFKNAHRVKEYNCGEKDEAQLNMYYFEIPKVYKTAIMAISVTMIVILIVGVLL